MNAESITIANKYNGPPGSGNGGYVAGRLASYFDGPVVVTLRIPPPLETPLSVNKHDDGRMTLDTDDGTLVAEAKSAELTEEVPAPPTLAEAEDATTRFAGLNEHTFPTCFVCGTGRPDDGLHIQAGPVKGSKQVASPWTPAPEYADADGNMILEICWAALDCPGAFAVGVDDPVRPHVVLGRMSAEMHAPIRAGEKYVVSAWERGSEGRKHYAGTAVHTADGELCAQAEQTWIQIA